MRSFSVFSQSATKFLRVPVRAVLVKVSALFLFQLLVLLAFPAMAQQRGISPGEGFVTRFSGILTGVNEEGREFSVINPNGVVGSVIDVRRPGQPPAGQHWRNEPQHTPVFASDIGQVFGIAIDDASPPNIYLTATAAFGLHRDPATPGWMAGMWGRDGGPGTIYRLSALNNYQPEVFANITLEGRANTGASLGNIAYDARNRQLFVTDLETGMIHRLDAQTGENLGVYDHGLDGRSSFIDVATGLLSSLPLAAFDPRTSARIADCESAFSQSPKCWNIANHKRRIWGVGVRTDPTGAVRLFYGTWGTAPFADTDFVSGSDDARNWIWSVGIAENGSVDVTDVRREFILPNLNPGTPAKPHAPADIAFSRLGMMLIGERGSMRNLGLETPSPFAIPAISRVLRYSQGDDGRWALDGNYFVGNLDVSSDSEPLQLNNSSGGVALGYGYGPDWTIDELQPERFVWLGGDALCSPAGPCFNPATGAFDDTDEVHGIEGTSVDAVNSPEAPQFTGQSYKIDSDLNVNTFGQVLPEEAVRNDASKVGDVEIYSAARGDVGGYFPPMPVHNVQFSAFHRKYESAMHDKTRSLPTHNKVISRQRPPHNKIQSGWRPPHNKIQSGWRPPHNKIQSGWRPPHNKIQSGWRPPHNKIQSGWRPPHNKIQSGWRPPHNKIQSGWRPPHNKIQSGWRPPHNKIQSGWRPPHNKIQSGWRPPHNKIQSGWRPPHNKALSRVPRPLHNKVKSAVRPPHNKALSRVPLPLHNKVKSAVRPPHNKALSRVPRPMHNKVKSAVRPPPIHKKALSRVRLPPHNKIKSRVIVRPPHNKIKSRVIVRPPHNKVKSRVIVRPPHNKVKSRGIVRPLHNKVKSRTVRRPLHNKIKSRPVVRPPKGPILRNPAKLPRVRKPTKNPQVILPLQNNLIIQPPVIKKP